MSANRVDIDLAHLTSVQVVHPIADTQGHGGHKIAGYDFNRGLGQGHGAESHTELGLDFHTDGTGGLLDTVEGGIIGDTHAIDDSNLGAQLFELFVDLRASAMDEDQPDAQAIEQGQVMDQVGELGIGQHFPTESNYKGAAPKGAYVRRGLAKPADKGGFLLFFSHSLQVSSVSACFTSITYVAITANVSPEKKSELDTDAEVEMGGPGGAMCQGPEVELVWLEHWKAIAGLTNLAHLPRSDPADHG